MPKPQAKTLTIDEESAGQRLDNFLVRQLKGVPKTHIYSIIRSGEVRLNRGRVGADARVQAGDLVRLPPVRTSERASGKALDLAAGRLDAPAREFVVLFEDDHLLAIDKPAGLAVHGGSGVSFGVIEQLRVARPKAPFWSWCTGLTGTPAVFCCWPKNGQPCAICRTSFGSGKPVKPIWRWWLVSGLPIARCLISRYISTYCPTASAGSG